MNKTHLKSTQEYVINEYIKLRLEKGKTQIYVGGKKFIHCKELMLNIPKSDIEDFSEINSIDEAEELYQEFFRDNQIYIKGNPHPKDHSFICKITPEQEFQGHCSNLQVWAENNYDTRLLHSNIAFPLLRKLSDLGDTIAKKCFKKEIVHRFIIGNSSIRKFLVTEGYMSYLERNEFFSIFEKDQAQALIEFENRINKRFEIILEADDIGSPAFWIDLKNLNILGLSVCNCNLKSIPNKIQNLTHLISLYLSKNNLKELPEVILNLKKLRNLDISYNKIKIPLSELKIPKSIKSLEYSGNPIK